jgi:hypothetical protein
MQCRTNTHVDPWQLHRKRLDCVLSGFVSRTMEATHQGIDAGSLVQAVPGA